MGGSKITPASHAPLLAPVPAGIITAFAPEVEAILDRMTVLGKTTYAGRAFFIGKLNGKLVAVTTSG